ncbi:IS3 family transposase [Streptomyces mirabilis]
MLLSPRLDRLDEVPAARQTADEALAHKIPVIHVASRQTYGVPRIHAEPRRLGQRVNRKLVARVMRERGIQSPIAAGGTR